MSTTEDHNPSRLGQDEAEEAQVYELGYLILPSIPEENLSEVVTRLKKVIKDSGGVEIGSEDPFKMDLAYTMSKAVGSRKYVVNDAYIGWVKFDLEPEAVLNLSDAVKNMEEVLRFLLIKVPRATTFTFESARKAMEEAQKELQSAKQEVQNASAEAHRSTAPASEAASQNVVE